MFVNESTLVSRKEESIVVTTTLPTWSDIADIIFTC